MSDAPPNPQRIRLAAGARLFEQGQSAECAFILERGRIRILARRQGVESVINEIGPGEILGELAVIDSGRRTASAVAVDDCELSVITRAQLADRVERADPVLRLLLRQIMGHLRREINDSSMGGFGGSPTIDRIRLENELAAAVSNRQLELWYQPIVDLELREIVGFEALVRWRHPHRGLVSPAQFIPIAEESGLIVPMGLWALEQGAQDLARFDKLAGGVERYLTVNVSGRQLEATNFGPQALGAVDAAKVARSRVRFEVTESLLIQSSVAREALYDCRREGISFMLDDFGTGYSSLAYLNQLPFDGLKIDRSFAPQMLRPEGGLPLVRAIVGMAQGLGRSLVMEGIESASQRDAWRQLGGNVCQGFLFSRPLPFEQAAELAADSSALPWGREG